MYPDHLFDPNSQSSYQVVNSISAAAAVEGWAQKSSVPEKPIHLCSKFWAYKGLNKIKHETHSEQLIIYLVFRISYYYYYYYYYQFSIFLFFHYSMNFSLDQSSQKGRQKKYFLFSCTLFTYILS